MRATEDKLTPGRRLKHRHIGFQVRILCLKVKGVSLGPDLLGRVTWEGVRCWTLRTLNDRGDVCSKKQKKPQTKNF